MFTGSKEAVMEEQAEGLRELLGYSKEEEQKMLGEVYAAIEKEDYDKAYELEQLREEVKNINLLLDSYGIPRTDNKIKLSAIERLELAMKMRMYA